MDIHNNSADYARFTVGTHGNLDITTVDGAAAAAHFKVATDGSIILDAGDGKFIYNNHGTEFSPADSAYAGMILGYTSIGYDEGDETNNLSDSSYQIPTDEFKVSFVVPPSENVLIEVQIQHDNGSSGVGDLYAGLSTANKTSGYAQLQAYHEIKINNGGGRGKVDTVNISWTLTAADLPDAGVAEEIWVGFKAEDDAGTPHVQWGGDATGDYPNFIMKATALPATILT